MKPTLATTFTDREVQLMRALLDQALRSNDPKAHSKTFASLARKVHRMQAKSEGKA